MIFTMTEAEEVKTFDVDVYHMHSKYLQEYYQRRYRGVYGLGDICMVHLTEQVDIPKQVKGLFSLTLIRPIGLPPHTPVAQNIANQRRLIANSDKNRYLFYL